MERLGSGKIRGEAAWLGLGVWELQGEGSGSGFLPALVGSEWTPCWVLLDQSYWAHVSRPPRGLFCIIGEEEGTSKITMFSQEGSPKVQKDCVRGEEKEGRMHLQGGGKKYMLEPLEPHVIQCTATWEHQALLNNLERPSTKSRQSILVIETSKFQVTHLY